MRKKAWFFKNGTVSGILGVMLVFAMFATGCPNGSTDDSPPKTYTVTFNLDGGNFASAEQTQTVEVEEGKTVTRPADDPTKTGYTFDNWYQEDKTTLWNFDTNVIVQDMTIYANWESGDVSRYKVTFDAVGGAPAPKEQNVLKGKKVAEPAKPTKSGFIFDGWYNENNKWDFGTDTVTQAVTLKAGWIEAVTVTFNSNGGSAINPVTVAKGRAVELYNYQPARANYVFDGWYKDAEFKEPAGDYLEKVNTSLTLYAKWTSTSVLAPYAGVWRSDSRAYWLQNDGTAWIFYSNGEFSKTTWSTSQIDGDEVTFNADKTTFTRDGATYTKNTTEKKTPTAATGALLGVWASGSSQTMELKTDKTTVLTSYGTTITLNYCAEASAVYLLERTSNLVILSISITDGKLSGFSKPASDAALAGVWKLTEGGQDYYWTLDKDGKGTFHTLGVSVSVNFIVTGDGRIDGRSYTISGNTLTLPKVRWDEKTDEYVDVVLTKATSVPSGSGADGDSRVHGAWKMTRGGETMTITFRNTGVMEQGDSKSIWKADGTTIYMYGSSFDSSRRGQAYSVTDSTLTIGGTELTR